MRLIRLVVRVLPLIAVSTLLVAQDSSTVAPTTPGRATSNSDAPNSQAPRADDYSMVRTLVISQEANGLPNQPTKEKVLQRMFVAENHLRLEDVQGGVIYLLELVDGVPHLKETSIDGGQYREGERLDELQRSRDRAERQTLERLKKSPDLERKSVMEKLHLRPGLERDVKIVRTGETEEILGRTAERVLVTENGRTIVDVWLAPSEEIDVPFFQFYSKVGAFSKEVLARLGELKGLPLRVEFTVVTATLAYKIDVAARDIEVEEVPLGLYRVKPGATLVKAESVANCPICGHEVEISAPPAGQSRRRDGSVVYFDSRECKIRFNRETYPEKFGGKPK